MKRLVFFDLDGTVLGGVSSENAFFFHLLKNRYIGFKQFLKALYFIPKWALKFKQYVFIKDKAYLTGLSKEEMERLGEKFVTEKLLAKIRPRLKERIEEHRRAGDKLILLTGSFDFLAKVFANHLNMDEVQATHCSYHLDRFLHFPPTQQPFSAEKLTIAKRLCKKYAIDLKDCAAYGNSYNDRILLREVGQPVAVTPSRNLRRIAVRNGWEIIN
jgi:HAD superfamily hydrolase (TIGR01490 family)